jgi:hypothetical protein
MKPTTISNSNTLANGAVPSTYHVQPQTKFEWEVAQPTPQAHGRGNSRR